MKKQKRKHHQNRNEDAPNRPGKKKAVYFPVNYRAGILVALVSVLLYSNTFMAEYAVDDAGAITTNQYVQKGIAGIPDLLKTDFWQFSNVRLGYYRPLSLISFAVEHQFFGNNPHVSHIVNVLLFGLLCYVLFILLSKLFRSNNFVFPLLIALLFAVHPVHTEVVSNIKSRDELMSLLNVVLMILFSIKYLEERRTRHLVLSLFFFYLALLSKETAMIGIILLPLLLLFYQETSIKDLVIKTVPYVIVLLLFLMQKRMLIGEVGTIPEDLANYPYRDGAVKVPTAFLLFAFGLKLLFIPHPLRYDYSYNQIPAAEMSDAGALAGIILFIAGIMFIMREFKKRTPLVLGMLILYISLIPMMAFILLRGGIFAERFLFIPSLGFCIALVSALGLLFKMDMSQPFTGLKNYIRSGPAVTPILVVIMILFGLKTFSRNFVWQNETTLFSTDVKTGYNSSQNQRHYGSEMMRLCIREQDSVKKEEYKEKAIAALKRGVEIHPGLGECYNGLGVLYKEGYGMLDSGLYYFNKAIEATPGLAIAYYNMGVIYQLTGRNNVASYYYNQSLKLNPYYPDAVKARDEMRSVFGLDVQVNPLQNTIDTAGVAKNSMYYYNMGNHYAANGDYNQAAENFRKAVDMNPGFEGALLNLSNCYGMLKQYDKSIEIGESLLRINPNNVQALENLAITYNKAGDLKKSKEYENRVNALRK